MKESKKERKKVMSHLCKHRITHVNESHRLTFIYVLSRELAAVTCDWGTALKVSLGTHVTALCYTCGCVQYF